MTWRRRARSIVPAALGSMRAEAASRSRKFKIQQVCRARLGLLSSSGRSLRRSPATSRSCGPPPPGGCGPHGLFKAEVPLCRFSFRPRAAACERHAPSGCKSRREERAFAGQSCGPLRPCGRKFKIHCDPPHRFRSRQARSRADGLAFEQREIAALRPGAAAGCRSWRTDFAGRHFYHNRRLRPAAPIRAQLKMNCSIQC